MIRQPALMQVGTSSEDLCKWEASIAERSRDKKVIVARSGLVVARSLLFRGWQGSLR